MPQITKKSLLQMAMGAIEERVDFVMGQILDNILDPNTEAKAKDYSKTAQVARCGNAVPPPFAKALAAANLPEYSAKGIDSMARLEEVIAA